MRRTIFWKFDELIFIWLAYSASKAFINSWQLMIHFYHGSQLHTDWVTEFANWYLQSKIWYWIMEFVYFPVEMLFSPRKWQKN